MFLKSSLDSDIVIFDDSLTLAKQIEAENQFFLSKIS